MSNVTFSSIDVVTMNTQYYGGLAYQMGRHGTAPPTDGNRNGNTDTDAGECWRGRQICYI